MRLGDRVLHLIAEAIASAVASDLYIVTPHRGPVLRARNHSAVREDFAAASIFGGSRRAHNVVARYNLVRRTPHRAPTEGVR
jgi:hypothetical protein